MANYIPNIHAKWLLSPLAWQIDTANNENGRYARDISQEVKFQRKQSILNESVKIKKKKLRYCERIANMLGENTDI